MAHGERGTGNALNARVGGPSKSALLSWLSWIAIAGFGAGLTMLLLGHSGTNASQVDRVTTIGAPVAVAQLAPPPTPPPVQIEIDTRPVAGYLIDSTGAPVVDAMVTSVGSVGVVIGRPSRTSDDGSFRLSPVDLDGAAQLRIDGSPVLPAQVTWQAGGSPPRIIVARRISLLATVTRDGAAAANVDVHLRDGGNVDRAVVRTDEHGVVRFADLPAGAYELWAASDSAVSGLARVSALGAESKVTLDLAAARALSGKLLTAGPIPAGSTVSLVPVGLDHASRTSAVAADGSFRIAALPAGQYQLHTAVTGYVSSSPQQITVTTPSKVVSEPVAVALVKVGRAHGVVIDDNGLPIIGATIVLRNEAGNRTSAISVATQSVGQWVHPLAGSRQMPIRDSRKFGAARPLPRPAECGAGHCGVDLGTVAGKLVHAVADGVVVSVYPELRGAAGRYVAILHPGGLRTQYMHLAEVSADLVVGQEVLAGTPLGIVGKSGVHVSGPHLHFSLAQELGDRTWYLDPEALLQNAVVLPEDGTLATPGGRTADLRIATVRTDGGRSVTIPDGARRSSNGRGEFTVDELAPGRYAAIAVAPGYTSSVPVAVTVASGGLTDRITLVLERGVMIAGRVRGPAGPIAGARVTLESSGAGESVQVLARATTGSDGQYSLVAPRGEVSLVVAAAGYGERERGLDLRGARASDDPRNEDFELGSAASRLHGEVLDDVGVPAGGVVVRIVAGASGDRRTRTDAMGQFKLDGVASGQYQVELLAVGRPPTKAELVSDSFTSLRLRAGASIDVLVLDHHTGRALAGVVVRARGTDGATENPRTDNNGQASLRGLLPGTYRLRVEAPGYVAAEQRVTVLEGTRAQAVRLELARGAKVAGTVRDGYGQRVAGARVWLGEAETRTDSDGNFRMSDVPTGAGTLRAERDDESGSVALTLSPGDETLTLTVNLQ